MLYIGKNGQQIFDHIRNAVLSGDLTGGDLLPSVRDLALELGVNRNTVSAVYMRLTKAGITVSNGRLGTSISLEPSAGEQEGASDSSVLIDLADGNPNAQYLVDPSSEMSKLSFKPHLYGDAVILPELVKIGSDYLSEDCPNGFTLTLTNGAIDAIERLLAAHLVAGDKVAVEDPCFLGTINILRLARMKSVGVEIDEQGIIVESLERALKAGVRALIITPRAHNPTGFSLSKTRAAQLRLLLKDYANVLIVIDDHFSLLSHQPYHSILETNSNRWALIRSVSKGLGPDLRLAFVASDQTTAKLLGTRLAPGMNWVSLILQRIVTACWHAKSTRDKLGQAKAFYQIRQNQLIEALQARGISVAEHCDGLNVWILTNMEEKSLCYALAKKGWLVRMGGAFSIDSKVQAIRVTVTKLDAEQALLFARDLREALSK